MSALAARVEHDLSTPTSFDADLSIDERRGLVADGQADIVWMCGLETVQLLDSGDLVGEVAAAPVFGGLSEPVYHSVIVVDTDSDFDSVEGLAGSGLVVNEVGSWSGHHALRAHLAAAGLPLPFFRSMAMSGSHHHSLEMVATGAGDCASIDHTVWDHSAAGPEAGRLRVLGQTRDWPSPPITVSERALEAFGRSISEALTRERLGIAGVEGFVRSVAGDYEVFGQAMAGLGPVPADLIP